MTDVTEPDWRDDAPTQDAFGDNAFNVRKAVNGLSIDSRTGQVFGASERVRKIDDLADWPSLIMLVDQVATNSDKIFKAAEEFEKADGKRVDDPLKWLMGTLVDFVLNLCQPLQDILGAVTGNEARMKRSVEMWLEVVEGARQNGNYIAENGVAALEGWEGDAADAARHRIDEIGQGLQILGAFGIGLAVALRGFALLAKKLYDKVKEFLAKIAEDALIKWLPGMASGLATFGASTAATIALAVATIAGYIITAVSLVQLAISIFGMIPEIIDLIQNGVSQVATAFTRLA
jgi:hypothetical protein